MAWTNWCFPMGQTRIDWSTIFSDPPPPQTCPSAAVSSEAWPLTGRSVTFDPGDGVLPVLRLVLRRLPPPSSAARSAGTSPGSPRAAARSTPYCRSWSPCGNEPASAGRKTRISHAMSDLRTRPASKTWSFLIQMLFCVLPLLFGATEDPKAGFAPFESIIHQTSPVKHRKLIEYQTITYLTQVCYAQGILCTHKQSNWNSGLIYSSKWSESPSGHILSLLQSYIIF